MAFAVWVNASWSMSNGFEAMGAKLEDEKTLS